MFQSIYVEESVRDHPKTLAICRKFSKIPVIFCERYGEVFNRHNQNFRLQKSQPSLILAKKHGHLVLPTPEGYGIGSAHNFYFSHLLNCPFDCRYCFLQGMYNSAHFDLFVNYEDFEQAIKEKMDQLPNLCFFSGYDSDSLALEPVTGFLSHFLPFFKKERSFIEIRTKSANIAPLLRMEAFSHAVIAFSLTPRTISEALEHRVPSLSKRLEAIAKLQAAGWMVGLRFDPLIYCDDFREKYRELFTEVFSIVHKENLHSVTLGAFRLPKGIYKKMVHLYPEEKLFAHTMAERESMVSYSPNVEQQLLDFCQAEILKQIPADKLFSVSLEGSLKA